MRNILTAAVAAIAVAMVSATAPARAAAAAAPEQASPLADWAREGRDRAAVFGNGIRDAAQKAILLGGAVLYNHRHAIAGGALGCAAGAAVGASSAGAAAPPLSALGCAAGAAAGISLGRELDAP